MIGLIQRVMKASVTVAGQSVGSIDKGLLVLLGVERGDDEVKLAELARKVCNYRVFADSEGKTNLNVSQAGGELLVVSQFTLCADTHKGLRPGFSKAAEPELAKQLYQQFCQQCEALGVRVATGQFAADMQVGLVNDGPMTFWLQV